MITDPNITAKIIFSRNTTQLKSNGIQFMAAHDRDIDNGYVAQNYIAIKRNLYIALVISGAVKLPASVEQYKA